MKTQEMVFIFNGLQAKIQAPVPMPADYAIALLQEWLKRSEAGPDRFFEWLDAETKKEAQ